MADYKRTMSDENGDVPHETPDVSGVSNPNVAHEVNDINVFAVIKFIVALSAATAVVFVLMAGVMWVFERIEARNDRDVSPFAAQDSGLPQSEIKLQGGAGHKFAPESLTTDPDIARQMTGEQYDFQLDDPTSEWRAIKDLRWRELNSYGRLQNNPNEFRIPVERAKELLLERNGIPARQQSVATEATSAQITQANREVASAEQASNQVATNQPASGQPASGQPAPRNPLLPAQTVSSVPRLSPDGFEMMPTFQSSGRFIEKRPARPTVGFGQHASGQTNTPHGSSDKQLTPGYSGQGHLNDH